MYQTFKSRFICGFSNEKWVPRWSKYIPWNYTLRVSMRLTVSRTTAKKLAIRRKKWQILTFNRKSHHPIETLYSDSRVATPWRQLFFQGIRKLSPNFYKGDIVSPTDTIAKSWMMGINRFLHITAYSFSVSIHSITYLLSKNSFRNQLFASNQSDLRERENNY